MSFAQTLIIENKIFTKSDILHIWEEISQNGETELTLTFHDGIECSSKKDEILNDGKIIDQKKCERIKIECNNFLDKKFISFELNAEYSTGILRIKSEDQDWNSGNLERLSGKINSVTNQTEWIKNKEFLFWLLYILVSSGTICGTVLAFTKLKSSQEHLILILFLIIFVLPLSYFLHLLQTAAKYFLEEKFPNIEFDFGPEDKKFAKKWRNRLRFWLQFIFGIVILGIIIGLATNFIYDKIK